VQPGYDVADALLHFYSMICIEGRHRMVLSAASFAYVADQVSVDENGLRLVVLFLDGQLNERHRALR
jgi:hypothetical protein